MVGVEIAWRASEMAAHRVEAAQVLCLYVSDVDDQVALGRPGLATGGKPTGRHRPPLP
jgi:hypothetical protein